MRNLRIDIEYDGTEYAGWQVQPGRRTIQGEIEGALTRILRKPIRITGAGRTDQGVHALGQVANFLTDSRLSPDRIRSGLNALVPDDIHVREIAEVDPDFNSRFSARSKIYQYQILSEPSPVRRRYYWYVKYRLDLERMAKTVKYLRGRRDFRGLSVEDRDDPKSTVCDIMDIGLTNRGPELIIKFEADRFLRQLVRGMVGFMVDVGRGRYAPGETEQALKGKVRNRYFAPPHGLFLIEVKY
jgi:tRNA pseudouridine38-40 synthase